MPESWAPTMVGTLLSDVAPEAVVWRSHGRLAHGKLTILDGDPGLGKSTLALDWAARVSRGYRLPDGESEGPKGVILLMTEDGIADTIRPRIDAAGGDPSRILVLTEIPDLQGSRLFQLPTDIPLLEAMIGAMDAGLVVLDPFLAFLGEGYKANSDQDIRRALSPLALAAQRTGVSILLLRHLNKSGGDNALYRGGGSIGIIGTARFGLLIATDPDDPERRVLSSSKCNLARSPPSLSFRLVADPTTETARIEMLGGSSYTAADLLSSQGEDTDNKRERDECRRWLFDLLSEGPMPSTQVHSVARKAGFQERGLKRAKHNLRVEAYREGFGKEGQWLWRLPIDGHHEKVDEMPKNDIGGHRWTGNGASRASDVPAGSGIFVCGTCGKPRSNDDQPCPSCGEAGGYTA